MKLSPMAKTEAIALQKPLRGEDTASPIARATVVAKVAFAMRNLKRADIC
ncbi:hypothetical protein [Agrobacterium vitis]|nr:hypothetical protein [Agrobacterium vitis]